MSLDLEILKGGGVLKQFWKSRWKGGGSKNMPSIGGGVWIFSGPIQHFSLSLTLQKKW